jgi:hypothetical protein
MTASTADGWRVFAPGGRAALAGLPILLALLLAVLGEARAADTFMGVAVTAAEGTYVVKTDVTARDQPKNDGKRTATLHRADRLQLVGKASYGWLAFRKDGEDVGFVIAQSVMPLIDGRIAQPITGSVTVPRDITCSYGIRFTRKSPVEGEIFETSDYEVGYRCRVKGKQIDVAAYMFIIEGPSDSSDNPAYQISVDVPQLGSGDDLLSTVFLYRKEKNEVAFDTVATDDFRKKPAVASKAAANVAEALRAAAELAPGAWNDAAWDALLARQR